MKNDKIKGTYAIAFLLFLLVIVSTFVYKIKINGISNPATAYIAVTNPVVPSAYYEFENPNPKASVLGYGTNLIVPETPTAAIPVDIIDGAVGQYADFNEVGGLKYKLGRTDQLFSPSNASLEFAMKPKQFTHDINLFSTNDGSFSVWVSSTYKTTSTTTFKFEVETSTGNKILNLDFNGTGNKSISSIFDDNWHLFAFKFTNGIQEVWIDGQKVASKNSGGTLVLGVNKDLNFNNGQGVSYRNYAGKFDSLRIYKTDIPGNLIYQHYLNMQDKVNFADTTNITNVPNVVNPPDVYDPKQYLPNIILPSPATDTTNHFTDYTQNPVSVIKQLQNSPAPRYKTGTILGRNINVNEISYLSHTTPNNYMSEKYAAKSNVDTAVSILAELANNWNYYLDITNTNAGGVQPVELNNGSYYNFMGHILAYADAHPTLPVAITTNRNHVTPNDISCGKNRCLNYYQNFPANSYLQNSTGQFLDRLGNVSDITKFWSPISDPTLYMPDGNQQKSALAQIVAKLPSRNSNKKIDLIWDNGEVLYRLDSGVVVNPYTATNPAYTAAQKRVDPNLNSAYLSSSFVGVSNGIQKFIAKLYANEEIVSYRNKILSVPGLINSEYSMYAQDGWDTSTRFYWDEARKLLTSRNGQYYATTEIYTRYPWNWASTYGADNGVYYASYSLNTQRNVGDEFYSPFISPGWNINTTKNITPGQWLGLLKNYANTGAEYFYVGYFNRAIVAECDDGKDNDNDGLIDKLDSGCLVVGKDNDESGSTYNSVDGYPATKIWQNMVPSYAQAVFSKIDTLYKDSVIMSGDMKWDPNSTSVNSVPRYSFLSGDPAKWVTVRKVNSKQQYIISGNINRLSNILNSVPEISKARINLAGKNISFDVRPEGSVYFLDLTNTNNPIFYQLDGWHEDAHPYNWTSDFAFEAELFDTGISTIKTEGAGVSTLNFSGDNYESYINPSSGTLSYNFTPRNSVPTTYYLWFKSKSNNSPTLATANVSLDTNSQLSLSTATSSMSWCNKDANNNIVSFSSVSPSINHQLKFTGADSDFYFDKFILTKDANLNLGTCDGVVPTDTPPTTPTNFSETHTNNSVTLTWGASTDDHGITGYDIYKNGVFLANVLNNVFTYTDSSITSGNTYTYYVVAKDTAGKQSIPTNTLTITTIANTPLSITISVPNQNNLQGTEIISATTTGSYPITKVEFYRGATLIATAPTPTTPNVYTFPWNTLSPLVTNGTKNLTAKVYDSNGGVATSSILNVIVNNPDISAPTTPILSETHTNSTVTLTSNNATDIVGVVSYDIYKNGVFLINKISATLNYTDTTVSPGNTYTYYVQAKDGAGNKSVKSNDQTVVIPPIVYVPPTVSITSATTSTISANATDTDGIIENVAFTFSGPSNITPIVDTISPYSTTWDTTTALNGSYTITAIATDSQSLTASDSITVTINNPDIEAPSTPSIIENHTNSLITLSWLPSTDNVGVTAYDIYNAATGLVINTVTATTSSYNNLIPNTIYSFYVVARDAAGNNSANSNTVSVTTDPVYVPQNFTGTVIDDEINLAWTGNASITEYEVYLNNILISTTTSNSYTYAPTTGGSTYVFYLKAKDVGYNVSFPSTSLSFTIPKIVVVDPPKDKGGSSGGFLRTACNDRQDNDGDGLVDYPADKGCASALSNNELPYNGIIAKIVPPVVSVINPKVAGVSEILKDTIIPTTPTVAPIEKILSFLKDKLTIGNSTKETKNDVDTKPTEKSSGIKWINIIGEHPMILIWLFIVIIILLVVSYIRGNKGNL